MRLDPENMDAREWLANYLWEAPGIAGGDKDEALEQVDAITRRDPLAGHSMRGEWHFEDEEYAAAVQEYRAVLAVDFTRNGARYMIGMSYQQLEDWDRAFDTFENAVRIDSLAMNSWYQLGRTGVLGQPNLDRAIEAYQFYLSVDHQPGTPDHASAHWRLGMIYELQGDGAVARQEYERALGLDPEHEDAKKALRDLAKR